MFIFMGLRRLVASQMALPSSADARLGDLALPGGYNDDTGGSGFGKGNRSAAKRSAWDAELLLSRGGLMHDRHQIATHFSFFGPYGILSIMLDAFQVHAELYSYGCRLGTNSEINVQETA